MDNKSNDELWAKIMTELATLNEIVKPVRVRRKSFFSKPVSSLNPVGRKPFP